MRGSIHDILSVTDEKYCGLLVHARQIFQKRADGLFISSWDSVTFGHMLRKMLDPVEKLDEMLLRRGYAR